MHIKLIGFIVMHLFIFMEARLIPNNHPNYQGGMLEVTKVTPQSYEHEGIIVNSPNIAKKIVHDTIRKDVISGGGDMKAIGRKMESKGGFEEKPKAKKNSGGRKKEKLNVICNHNVKIRSNNNSPDQKAKNSADFVALSADYNDPKSHPPRHN